MAGYFLALMDIEDKAGFENYVAAGYASLEPYGIELVSLDDEPDLLEGTDVGQHIVILKFASKEKVREWYESESYSRIKGLRQSSCKTLAFLALTGP